MGYYTKYELDVKFRCPDCGQVSRCNKNIERKIRKTQIEEYDVPVGDVMDGNFEDCKWYGHERDVKVMSMQFPNVLFILSGKGEGNGDIWKKYFLNGKLQKAHAEIVISDFDFNQLR